MNTWAVPGYSESLELGSGASGRVVLAVHEPTGLPVAVKYLSESLRTRPGFVHGFRAEAELLGGLESPHVAGFYEYVEAPEGAAIVMELVDGVSLRTLLTRESPLSPESALVVLKGSLLGLADAHRAGVVHRDYKPENVLVTPEGTSKLVDFGIAVDAGIRAGVAGTPAYMAPEQWTGAPASPAGDVYAATATFFECLTGRKPYAGENLAQLALQHVEGEVPDEEVPAGVRALVRRGLAKTAEERPADAAAFVADLERAAVAEYGEDWEERGRGRLAALVALLLFLIPATPGTASGTTVDTARTVLRREPGAGRLHPWRPTWPGLVVATAAVLVALLLGQGLGQGAGAASGQAVATTVPSPVSGTSALPSVSPSASDASLSPSPSASTSASASASASDGAPSPSDDTGASVSPTVTWSDPGTPSGPPGGSASPSPSTSTVEPPVAPAVKDVTVTGFRQTGTATATTTITVTTDGTGPLTISVAWFSGDAAGQSGAADGAPVSFRRSGATQYTLAVDHTFQGNGCYWTVRATTNPASADGGASQQLLTRRCDLR
ncbi:serine/threonine-protein kinase [Streptomyces antibioticus]|uniref:non-specific serine/threonine protein kinase n=1 Tax=Streptomyces antibioticus TaxID=1890 RepID=A0AAE7CIV1_STRAT|nr:serine/threonine-protein kinase [Streptomyces antibioticus]OOQ54900.1 serine/threonine protein kinase [Streptomyces antibioticus]QIT42544.1 serine/threonine protein kinase [Streptomyces antibioticus]